MTTSNIKSRVMYGIPPINAIWEVNLLKQLWHIVIQCKNQRNLLWDFFIHNYKRNYIQTFIKVQKIKNISKSYGLLYDFCYVLNKFNLIKYWNIQNIPWKKSEWDTIIENRIYESYYQKDLEYLEQKDEKFIHLLRLRKYKKYNNEIPKFIDEQFDKENIKFNNLLLKILTESVSINWKEGKNLRIKNRPLCTKEWKEPLKHILTECETIKEKFKDHRISEEEKKMMSMEYIKKTLHIILENNFESSFNVDK